MTHEAYCKRQAQYEHVPGGSRARWNFIGKEGSLVQFLQDYHGWLLVSGRPDLNDKLRWTPEDQYGEATIHFLPGDIALYLGVTTTEHPLHLYWNYRFLWREIIVESGPVRLRPDSFLAKADIEVLSPDVEPWDCSELLDWEIQYRSEGEMLR